MNTPLLAAAIALTLGARGDRRLSPAERRSKALELKALQRALRENTARQRAEAKRQRKSRSRASVFHRETPSL